MTKEQLENAIAIDEAINDLKKHRDMILNTSSGQTDYKGRKLICNLGGSYSNRVFRSAYAPIKTESYVHAYLMNVDAKIMELEKEFESI